MQLQTICNRSSFCFTLLIASFACNSPIFARDRIHIITSFLPAYCFTCAIVGETAHVENLPPSSVDPHDFQLSPSDLRRLQNADLIVVNGLGLESWLSRITSTPGAKKKIATLSDGLTTGTLLISGDGEINPHIWLDPSLAASSITNILRAVQELDATNAQIYARNAEKFIQRLHDLDRKVQAALQPYRDQAFITYHDAFPYFARHYRINLVDAVERIPEVPPSARYLVKLFGIIRRERVRAIFTEKVDSPRLARQIARDAGIRLGTLDTIETGPLDSSAYEKAMFENAASLARLLSQ